MRFELLLGEAQRAPGVAHRHARAIGDHVRGHGGAARAVQLVHVLDHQLALCARRQIQIDVGHAVGGVVGGGDAFLGEEAFEQQVHPHGIDGGDPQDETDGGVRGRPPPLHHDPARLRELDDVPDDQEIAGQPEAADDPQLALQLPPHLGQDRIAVVVPGTHAAPGELLEIALLRLAGRDVVVGELVAEVGERERAALGDRARGAHGRGHVAKQELHLARRLEPALGVGRQAAADLVDGRLLARARQHVVHDPLQGPWRSGRRWWRPRRRRAPRPAPARRGCGAPRRRRGGAAPPGRRDRARTRRRAPADRRAARRPPARSAPPRARPADRSARRPGRTSACRPWRRVISWQRFW